LRERKRGGKYLMKRGEINRKEILFLILFVIFSFQIASQASEDKKELQVEYIKDNLTINVKNIALGALLNAIREKTGIEFVMDSDQYKIPVSFEFGPLPLAEGLKRVLNRFNHALLVGPDNKISRIIVLGYASSDSSSMTHQTTKMQDVSKTPPPSSTGKTETKTTKEKEAVIGSLGESGMTVIPSAYVPMAIEPSPPKDVSSKPTSEPTPGKTITGGGMVVTPSSGTMIITPGTGMKVTPYQGGMVVTPPVK